MSHFIHEMLDNSGSYLETCPIILIISVYYNSFQLFKIVTGKRYISNSYGHTTKMRTNSHPENTHRPKKTKNPSNNNNRKTVVSLKDNNFKHLMMVN
jgi:hypothetical protein